MANLAQKPTVMQKRYLSFAFLIALAQLFAGCEVIGDIFEAGVWVGVLVVVGIIGLIIWIISRFRS